MKITLEEAFAGKQATDPGADLGALRGLQRLRRRRRRAAGDLPDLPGPRQGAGAAGLLHDRAHLPDLPRRRPGHQESLQRLRRRGPRAAREDAAGQHPRRASRTAPASAWPARARRAARRAGRRPLHLPVDRAAPHVPARRRQHLLPRADPDDHGGAGRRVEVPTVDGGRAKVTIPAGTQTGQQFRLRGKGMSVLRSRSAATCMSRSRSRRR